jgi:pyruvate formate lyase activating enzyme
MICDFCYRHCDIKEGQTGYCRIRKVENNKLISTGYGYLDAIAIDPVEKKPLYHFMPGTKTLSVAEAGCNYRCDFCQNWQLSQTTKTNNSKYVSPSELVNLAIKHNTPSLSFTYSEPITWQDYVIDTSTLAKKAGLKTIMVTNGSFSNEALERLTPVIDAFNIDLKGDNEYYKTICKGKIEPVLKGIKYLVKQGNHVEVTTLLIEGIHTKETIKYLATTLKEYGTQVWHLSRFFPNYKMSNNKATSEEFLDQMINIANEVGIPFIYRGNSSRPSPTICPNCKHILIHNHYDFDQIKKDLKENLIDGKCKFCNSSFYYKLYNYHK